MSFDAVDAMQEYHNARALWIAVLVEAVRDLSRPRGRDKSETWLIRDQESQIVCDYAGVSHKALLDGLARVGLIK